MAVTGIVFDIQRYSIHDGPGIRSNIFLKGCPLRCQWCHNPEGLCAKKEISYLENKCTLCGRCVAACPNNCHHINESGHTFDRTKCTACGLCVNACFFCALENVGREMTAEAAVDEAARDMAFFKTSGGGITLSGGEPMMQSAFTKEILAIAKARGLSTCMETSGFCSGVAMTDVMPLVDLFLFDIKETDRENHIKYTGGDNVPILENLKLLSDFGKQIVLRCPIIPKRNDRPEHARNIASLANTHKGVIRVELEPYHPLGVAKSRRFGRAAAYTRDTFMKKQDAVNLIDIIRENTDIPVEVK